MIEWAVATTDDEKRKELERAKGELSAALLAMNEFLVAGTIALRSAFEIQEIALGRSQDPEHFRVVTRIEELQERIRDAGNLTREFDEALGEMGR